MECKVCGKSILQGIWGRFLGRRYLVCGSLCEKRELQKLRMMVEGLVR